MTDRIHIRDLCLRTRIGVHERERQERQEVLVSLVLETDLALPARTDQLDDTLDYGRLVRILRDHVEASDCRLLERLASSIAQVALEHCPQLLAVTVRVDKPAALPAARGAGVELRRTRA